MTLGRHLDSCNNAVLPGRRLPFRIESAHVGWIAPEDAALLPPAFRIDPEGVHLDGPPDAAIAAAAETLAAAGRTRLRGEAFAIRATPDSPALGRIDRGAVPRFGVIGHGVHLNGLVRNRAGLDVWVGIRSRAKATAPGLIDNLVAGGIPAGLDPHATLVKEAAEEASLPPTLLRDARSVGRITYSLDAAEGLRRDVLHLYDLDLPAGFTPRPADGEVERFELWPAVRLLAAVRDTDTVKFNVALVLIDLFLREGLVDPAGVEGRALRARLDPGFAPVAAPARPSA